MASRLRDSAGRCPPTDRRRGSVPAPGRGAACCVFRRYIDEIGIDYHILVNRLLRRKHLLLRRLFGVEHLTPLDVIDPAAAAVEEHDTSIKESIGDNHLHCFRLPAVSSATAHKGCAVAVRADGQDTPCKRLYLFHFRRTIFRKCRYGRPARQPSRQFVEPYFPGRRQALRGGGRIG